MKTIKKLLGSALLALAVLAQQAPAAEQSNRSILAISPVKAAA